MAQTLDPSAIDQLFRTARSHNKWQDYPVELSQLHALYDLMKWGPTSANTFPLRLHLRARPWRPHWPLCAIAAPGVRRRLSCRMTGTLHDNSPVWPGATGDTMSITSAAVSRCP